VLLEYVSARVGWEASCKGAERPSTRKSIEEKEMYRSRKRREQLQKKEKRVGGRNGQL